MTWITALIALGGLIVLAGLTACLVGPLSEAIRFLIDGDEPAA